MKFIFRVLLIAILAVAPAMFSNAGEEILLQKLSGKNLENAETIKLDNIKNGKALLLFWRSDCAPCLKEMALLPKIAEANSGLRIILISLHDVEHTKKYIPANLPKNVEIIVAGDNSREVLKTFANDKQIIPFSAMLHKDGSVCKTEYGILGNKTVKEWDKKC